MQRFVVCSNVLIFNRCVVVQHKNAFNINVKGANTAFFVVICFEMF